MPFRETAMSNINDLHMAYDNYIVLDDSNMVILSSLAPQQFSTPIENIFSLIGYSVL